MDTKNPSVCKHRSAFRQINPNSGWGKGEKKEKGGRKGRKWRKRGEKEGGKGGKREKAAVGESMELPGEIQRGQRAQPAPAVGMQQQLEFRAGLAAQLHALGSAVLQTAPAIPWGTSSPAAPACAGKEAPRPRREQPDLPHHPGVMLGWLVTHEMLGFERLMTSRTE